MTEAYYLANSCRCLDFIIQRTDRLALLPTYCCFSHMFLYSVGHAPGCTVHLIQRPSVLAGNRGMLRKRNTSFRLGRRIFMPIFRLLIFCFSALKGQNLRFLMAMAGYGNPGCTHRRQSISDSYGCEERFRSCNAYCYSCLWLYRIKKSGLLPPV